MKTELRFLDNQKVSRRGLERAAFVFPLVFACDVYFTRSAFAKTITAGTIIRSVLVTSALGVQNSRTPEEAMKYGFLVYLVIYLSILTIFSPTSDQLLSWSEQTMGLVFILMAGPAIAYVLHRFGPKLNY